VKQAAMAGESPRELRLSASGTWRERFGVFAPATLMTRAALVIAYQFVQPAPPRLITLATGPEHGAYFYYGQLYRERLAREGISVSLQVTRGSIENIELLKDSNVDVAFAQGGTGAKIEAAHLRFLASLYFEPVWMFVRKDEPITRLGDLRGRRSGWFISGRERRAS
jgi:TRAP-type uncharacterized transport system substrate-binding protein